jgi:hypothetical protein
MKVVPFERGGSGRLTHDDGHLHLEGIEVGQLRAGAVPGGVDAEGVGSGAGGGKTFLESARANGRVELYGGPVGEGVVAGAGPVTGAEDGGGHGEHLVVEQPGVDGEDRHQKNYVPTCRQMINK